MGWYLKEGIRARDRAFRLTNKGAKNNLIQGKDFTQGKRSNSSKKHKVVSKFASVTPFPR